jgi:acyl carrier protein
MAGRGFMSKTEIREFVIKTVKRICSRKGMKPGELPDEARLDGSGWGLDSLDIAEVSSVLEQYFGHDPATYLITTH